MTNTTGKAPSLETAREIVAQTETGARNPTGKIPRQVLFFVPLAWTLFQLWYASPLPFIFNIGIFNSTEARAIHLAFAIFLAYTAYPTFKKRSPRHYIPVQDWVVGLVAAFCAAYLFIFYDELSARPGNPTQFDLVVGVIGLILLLEATRRALGPPLMAVAAVFMIYTFFGSHMPDVIAHKGASLSKGMSHYWLSTEGVFGVAVGVSTEMVFMFVLFGALLEQAGAGNYFIRAAFAGLGHMRGGPAKAAVVASGLTGIVSGSSIANVVTTGTFTIPLMKKVGFPPEKAGAVEVACSTNGQLMPPVMGAAAFLMVEYVGISYIQVIKHAFLPAIISYLALFYIVHLEACKMGLKGLKRRRTGTFAQKMLTFVAGFLLMIVLTAAVYYGIGWIKIVAPDAAIYIVGVIMMIAYLVLIRLACTVPELEITLEIERLPPLLLTLKTGYYFLLPLVALIWCLVVERLSPSLSAYWATMLLIFIVVTQRPLKGYFRKTKGKEFSASQGFMDLVVAMVGGARNMIGIGVATAAAGVVVGTVTLTGIGLVMTEFVEFISGGNLVLILLFTAVISLLLGMGLPTTANYIVVSTLMAPVIVDLGAKSGLLVPLVAAHLFVFFFGILADDTPPVGLAAFAAAGISGGDPIRTGIQGFGYDIRTAVLPFIFIFNNELLMIGVGTWYHFIIVVGGAVVGMLVFAAATQRYFLTKNRLWETAALLLVTFTLLRPGFWWDRIYPPLEEVKATRLEQIIEKTEPGTHLRIEVAGEDFRGRPFTKSLMLRVGDEPTPKERMLAIGIETRVEDGRVFVDNIIFGSPAERAGMDFDQEILHVYIPADIPPKHLMFIPAFLLLALIWFLQRKRTLQLAAA
ncbi:MAG: C4-dicarboxylate ABC transporter [Deltaproteobacteria bacterium]|nr:MAG: C4-dicarboxylate ABC transporter [Deltaproteobacteria bacterium]